MGGDLLTALEELVVLDDEELLEELLPELAELCRHRELIRRILQLCSPTRGCDCA